MKRASMLFLAAMFGGFSITAAQDMDTETDRPDVDSDASVVRQFWNIGCGGSFLGVSGEEVTADKVRELNLPGEYGALVDEVVKESGAEDAGLMKNDVIVAYNGTRVESMAQLRRMISETPVGRTVELKVIRNGAARTIEAELGKRKGMPMQRITLWGPDTQFTMPDDSTFDVEGMMMGLPDSAGMRFFPEGFQKNMERFRIDIDSLQDHVLALTDNIGFIPGKLILGVTAQPISDQLARYFKLKEGQTGALLSQIHEGYPAERDGLLAGDVVTAIDGEAIERVSDLPHIISHKTGIIMVTLMRDGAEMTIPVDLGSRVDSPDVDDDNDQPLLNDSIRIPEDGPGLSMVGS